MQLNLPNVNWTYVGVAIAFWLALVAFIWRRPNAEHLDQWRTFKRDNPGLRTEYQEWLRMPNGPGAPVASGRVVPIAQVSIAFWSILLLFIYSAASAA
jgi:hypothetical protein